MAHNAHNRECEMCQVMLEAFFTTCLIMSRYIFSGIAQLVEQVTVNHRVAGSSPAAGATDL